MVKGLPIPRPGIPESFKVLMRELQALCLDVATYKLDISDNNELNEFEINLMSEGSENIENQLVKQKIITLNNGSDNLKSSFQTNFMQTDT